MEMILINDQESNIVLYLNNKAFYGYKFYNDNRVEKLDYSKLPKQNLNLFSQD